MTDRHFCHHCEGLGYIEIRDCSGEIQREETCSFCGGTGYIEQEKEESDLFSAASRSEEDSFLH